MLFVNVKPSANIWKVMPENCTSLNFHKTKNAKVTWVCHPSSRPVTCDHCIGIVMFAEWKMIAKYITNWYFKYSISCYMLISESLNMQNLLNNRKLQKHQIHCNLLCFDFHKCPIFRPKCTPWLKPTTSLQPFFPFLCEI